MNRTAKLNLLLGVNPSEFKNAIDKAVGGELRRVKVNVSVQLDGAGDSFGRSAVAQISKATVKADFSNFVADQLATRIAKATGSAVEGAVRKGFKGDFLGAITGLIGKAVSIPVEAVAGTAKAALGAIASGATATARTAFEGVIFGVTQSASAELGAGISAGLQGALGKSIGSPELLGRKIVEKLSKAILDAATQEGVNLPGIGKAVQEALGEQEVLTDSRAKSAKDRQVKKQRQESAQVELNRERQEAVRLQSEAIEAYARIAASVEKQSKQLIEKNREAVKDLRAKLSELASQGDSADKTLENDLKKQLNRLLSPLVELENIQKQAREELNQVFIKTTESRENIAIVEGGDAFRSVLQKRAENLNKQQLDLADRIQALQGTLAKGLKAEQALGGQLETASDSDKPELLALQEEAKASIQQIANQINGLKKTRTGITDEIERLAQQARTIPKGPNKVVVDILKELGFEDIDPENVPQIQLATDATLDKTSKADYVPEANLVRVRQELFDELQTGQSTQDLSDEATRRTIREEIAHSAQFEFGSVKGNKAFVDRKAINQVSDPTAEEIQRIAPELQGYVKSGRGKDAQVELEAKVAADRLAEKNRSIEKQAKDLLELEKTFGYAGVTVSRLLAKVGSDRPKIEALMPQARALGDEAIAQVQALEDFLDQIEQSTRQALQQVAEAKTGKAPQIDVAKQKEILADNVRQLFGFEDQIKATDLKLQEIAQRPSEPTKQAAPLAIATEQVSELGNIVNQVGSFLSPIGPIADGTVHALATVGKAGLALADKFGFAAASLIPGGALAYGPTKAAVKVAGPAIAAGALATQVPAAGEIIGAISSAVTAILAPMTSGVSASVGHAVSAEIAGALPTLFSSLSRLVVESGLPGSEITAAAVDKLGGGLIHLLEPVISGVAHTADSTVVSIGHAVNEFLGQVGGLLLAGKGLQEGVKLAASPDAREAALDTIQTVGAGVGQTINGVTEGVENVKNALDRTKRAVERNVEEIKAGTQDLAQGNVRAIVDIKDSAEAAVSNIARGAQDIGKAVNVATNEVREGVGKIVDARPKVNISEPDPWLQPETIEVKAQAIELEIPKITHEVPAQYVDVEAEEVDLVVTQPRTKLDDFREQLARLDEARDTKIDDIRSTYKALQKDVTKSKAAAQKGNIPKLRELQEAIATKRTKILKEVDDLSQETEEILQALNALGIETGANTPIRDKISALRQSLTKTRKGTIQQVAKMGAIPGVEPPDSLQALNLDSLQESIDLGAKSLSGALKSLVETIFEVRGETLAESLALAAQSPRGKDLAVNTAGLAASVAASSQGPVAGITADLVGALAARQAVGGGGAETFGDLAGFITGNVTNKLTGIAGSGAIAASIVVPQLQKLRDQIQAKYGQPLDIEIPIDARLEGLQEIDPGLTNANKQLDKIDALLADLRKLEAEGKLITPTVGERIRGFLGSIAKAFSKNDSKEIAIAIARIETELARGGEAIDAKLQEQIQDVEKESAELQKVADNALIRLERTLNEFDRIEDKINDRADRLSGDAPPPNVPTTEGQNSQAQARRAELESEQQQQISEIDKLIAEEQSRLSEARRLATEEQRLKIAEIDRQINDNLAQLNIAKTKAQSALDKTKDPTELLSKAALGRRSPQEETLARIAQAAQRSRPDPALDKIERASATAKAERDAGLDAIAKAAEQGRQDREQFNQRLADIASDRRQLPSNTKDSFTPLIAPQRPFSDEEKLEQQRAEGRKRQTSALETQRQATAAIQSLDPQQALGGIEAIALSAKAQQQAIDTVDSQLEKAALEGKNKADDLTRRLRSLREEPSELPSNTRELPPPLPPPPVDPVFVRLSQAAQEGARQQNAVTDRLAAAAQEGKQAAQSQHFAFAQIIEANTEIIRAAEESAKGAEQVSNEAFKGMLAVQDAKAAEERVTAKLKELQAQRDPIYDAPQPSSESDLLSELGRQREQTARAVQDFQAEDLNQFVVPRQTFTPTDEDRGIVAQKRIERDASERQINDTLRRGKATGSVDENQAAADLAIASFEKNEAKFNAVAQQIKNGSTKTQEALRKAGETFSTFRQKLEENGGIGGVLSKVGDSLNAVAQKAGLPTGTLGKLSGIIKGVGIAALAYVGITQLGDALVELGRRAFEVSTRVETLQTQLKFVGGESNLPENLAFIRKESERLKRPLDQVTEGITQLSIATKDTALEGRTQEIASVIGTLGRVYGLSAENTKSIQYQLGQTIRLGRAQGDELRSISDAGINVQGALEKVLGKSGTDVRKQLEAGQISAVAVVDALKLLSDTAKAGLPEALNTSAASLDNLNRKFTDVAVLAGEKLKPAVVGGIGAIGAAIDFAVETGSKLEPFLSAVGQALGVVMDVATPIVGVIAAIGGAIANDLIQGAAIPFQLIGAGLSEIRKGLDALENAATQALGAIASSLPSGLGEILKYANPVTIAIRALGLAIGINLVASITQSSIAIAGTMVPAMIGLATTIWTTVIPAIAAARVAALAFIATPLGATITAIAVAAALAAPHIDDLALAFSGLDKAQVSSNERAIAFNSQYTKGLNQLQKGIPLTAEKLQELKDGFIQNAKEGKGTAREAAILSANLDRLQANAQAAAKIQSDLAEAMKKSTEAIKNQSKAIDSDYNERLAGLNESLANQQITRERFDAAELEAQQEKTAKYTELYQTQGDALRTALSRAQAQLSQPIPDSTRAEVVKQVTELEAQINDVETKSSEQRILTAQNRVKKLEAIEKGRVNRATNEVKALENLIAAGVTVEQEIELEKRITDSKEKETTRRINDINRQLKTEISANGESSEIAKNLYSERAVLETELTKLASEETSKRHEILLKDVEQNRDKLAETITESEIETNIEIQKAQNAGLYKQAEVEWAKTNNTQNRLKRELALELANIEKLAGLPSPTDPKKVAEHEKRIRAGKLKTAQLTQSMAENEYKRLQEIRQATEKAIEEQVKGVENAANAIELLGKIGSTALDRQTKILEAQKRLRASILGLHDEEFKILIETETNERDKADLQEKAAKFRLDSLRESQALEEKILEIQIAQERVQNRVAILKAQAAVAKAEAEKAKVEANPESTDADKQAAALGLEASQIELGATVESARLQEGLAAFKRQQAQVDNRKELLGARFDYAKSIVDPLDRRDAIERVQASAARGLRERNNPQSTPRFALPTPVNLHSGVGAQGLQMAGLSADLRELRLLTQNGVAANLVALVSATERTNTYLSTIAGRRPVTVQRNNTTINNTAARSNGGIPI